MALIYCSECGHQISDKAKTCPNCGAPVTTSELNNFGTLYIGWKGIGFMLLDSSVDLFVNYQFIGTYSLKRGFFVEIPILSSQTEVLVKLGGIRTTKQRFTFEPAKDYLLSLDYSRLIGNFKFKIEANTRR